MTNKFLQIKEADNFGNKYYYAERLGKDSVAFILYNAKTKWYGLIREYKPPIDEFLITAFGGSLDKPISKVAIVKGEVLEETGFEITIENIEYKGKIFVSTQMNQFCHLYLIDVTNAKNVGRQPQNECEAKSEVVWFNNKQDIIENTYCHKAITIVSRI